MKINSLEIQNVKKVKALKIDISKSLTVIGGNNNQGKTSVLDAICFALGGAKYKPSNYKNTSTVGNPSIKIQLDNGILVERSGKNGTLKVTDQDGKTGGQNLLNKFVETLALDLPKFLNSNDKDKAKLLLNIIGVEQELLKLDNKEQELFNERHAQGQITDQKKKYAKELAFYPDVPEQLLNAGDLIQESQKILLENAKNREAFQDLCNLKDKEKIEIETLNALRKRLADQQEKVQTLSLQIENAEKEPFSPEKDISEIQAKIDNIEIINTKIRSNFEKSKAEEDANVLEEEYKGLTLKIEEVRKQKLALLQSADLPLPELSIEDGVLTYNNIKWDCMSSSEQLKVSTAIVQHLNPECKFVLIDKLEQMDATTLSWFEKWLDENDMQVIGTRVSTGDECSIIIEDGIEKIKEEIKFNVGDF